MVLWPGYSLCMVPRVIWPGYLTVHGSQGLMARIILCTIPRVLWPGYSLCMIHRVIWPGYLTVHNSQGHMARVLNVHHSQPWSHGQDTSLCTIPRVLWPGYSLCTIPRVPWPGYSLCMVPRVPRPGSHCAPDTEIYAGYPQSHPQCGSWPLDLLFAIFNDTLRTIIFHKNHDIRYGWVIR